MKTSPIQTDMPRTSITGANASIQHGMSLRSESSIDDARQEATRGRGAATAALELSRNSERPNVERPLTCDEAAAFVRVHPKTVKRMARNGELPGHFRFGRWFFYASELDSWMRTELHSSGHSCR
jgi:excisionase family DNA binding protein